MKSMYNSEIPQIEDEKLKLQYVLGGLSSYGKEHTCSRYWSCDIKCRAMPVPDDENLAKVIQFMQKHNLDVIAFLEITYSYLRDGFYQYGTGYGPLLNELEDAIKNYTIRHLKRSMVDKNEVIIRDYEILTLLSRDCNNKDSELSKFLLKYSLTAKDFIVLAKTRLNFGFFLCRGFESSEFYTDLNSIIRNNIPFEDYDTVRKIREDNSKKPHQPFQEVTNYYKEKFREIAIAKNVADNCVIDSKGFAKIPCISGCLIKGVTFIIYSTDDKCNIYNQQFTLDPASAYLLLANKLRIPLNEEDIIEFKKYEPNSKKLSLFRKFKKS